VGRDVPPLPVAVLGKVWPSGGGLFVWYADRIQSGAESRALQRAVGFGVSFGVSFVWFNGFGCCEVSPGGTPRATCSRPALRDGHLWWGIVCVVCGSYPKRCRVTRTPEGGWVWGDLWGFPLCGSVGSGVVRVPGGTPRATCSGVGKRNGTWEDRGWSNGCGVSIAA